MAPALLISMAHLDDDYDTYDVPLHKKQPFGAGISRQPVAFVRASSGTLDSTSGETQAKAPSKSMGDTYLGIVMQKRPGTEAAATTTASSPMVPRAPGSATCEVCNLPLNTQHSDHAQDDTAARAASEPPGNGSGAPRQPHEASLVHQIRLAHSHPPSALDRSRMGLRHLSSRGWDPDSRRGLGAEEQGVRAPLRVRPKEDTLGVGAVVAPEAVAGAVDRKKNKAEGPKKTLDAKGVRKMQAREKKRHESLTRAFYASSDLEKYLGKDA